MPIYIKIVITVVLFFMTYRNISNLVRTYKNRIKYIETISKSL